jgi:tetratricopeptide (TPR) repeat protein
MPRPAHSVSADGLPLWDTFEVLFIFAAGVSAGIVLGFLLPSLWRTLRRRFRNLEKISPRDESILQGVTLPFSLLDEDDSDSQEVEQLPHLRLVEAFLMARYCFQEGKTREAVRLYLELLKNDRISKGQTNRALFELAQCYHALGLGSRALDTLLELYYRRPDKPQVLLEVLTLCRKLKENSKTEGILQAYQGPRNEKVRMAASAALCLRAEIFLEQSNRKRSLDAAREALRWHSHSAHGQMLIWSQTGTEIWNPASQVEDARLLWSALAVDLEARTEISLETGLSEVAGAEILASRLAHLASLPQALEVFKSARKEFRETSGLGHRSEGSPTEATFEKVLCYSILALLRWPGMAKDPAMAPLVSALMPTLHAQFLIRCLETARVSEQPRQSLLSFFLHECRQCKALTEDFQWYCPQCQSLDTLQIKHTHPWTGTQSNA